jgi:hypothetical protein
MIVFNRLQNLSSTGQILSYQNTALEALISNLKVAESINGDLRFVKTNLDEVFSFLNDLEVKSKQ